MYKKYPELNKYLTKLNFYFIYEPENDTLLILNYIKSNNLLNTFKYSGNSESSRKNTSSLKDVLKKESKSTSSNISLRIKLSEFPSLPKNIFVNGDLILDYKRSNINFDSINLINGVLKIFNFHKKFFNTSVFCNSLYFKDCLFSSIQENYIHSKSSDELKSLQPNTLYLNKDSTLSFKNCYNLTEMKLGVTINSLTFDNTPSLKLIGENITVNRFFNDKSVYSKLPDSLNVLYDLTILDNNYLKNINNIANKSFDNVVLNNLKLDELPSDLKTNYLDIVDSGLDNINPSIHIKRINNSMDNSYFINTKDFYKIKFNYTKIKNIVYKINKKNSNGVEELTMFIALNNQPHLAKTNAKYSISHLNQWDCKPILSKYFSLSPIYEDLFYQYLVDKMGNDPVFIFTYFSKTDKIEEALKKYDNQKIFDSFGNSIFKYVKDKETLETIFKTTIKIDIEDKNELILSDLESWFEKYFLLRDLNSNLNNLTENSKELLNENEGQKVNIKKRLVVSI